MPEARVALEQALRHLDAGRDPRDLDGVRADALQAIAWALVGLLSERVREDGLQETLTKAGFGAPRP